MSDQLSVPPNDGIHGTQPGGHGCQFIKKGNHILFIGNRYIDAVPVSLLQKVRQFPGLFLKQPVGIVTQRNVDLRGIAVAQFSAKKSALHYTISR